MNLLLSAVALLFFVGLYGYEITYTFGHKGRGPVGTSSPLSSADQAQPTAPTTAPPGQRAPKEQHQDLDSAADDPFESGVGFRESLAIGSAAIVAAIVAAALALPLPKQTGGGSAHELRREFRARLADSVGGTAPSGDDMKMWLSLAYVFSYVAIGLGATVAALMFDGEVSKLVLTQAITFWGLVLAAARATFLAT